MSEPFLGEIRTVGFQFAPVGWAFCNGQLLSIAENDALFNLLGTTYGGDGMTTFGVPDLRSRVPIHQGTLQGGGSYTLGQSGGAENVTLAQGQMPQHTHQLVGTKTAANQKSPQGNVFAQSQNNLYGDLPPFVALNGGTVNTVGGGQPHDNMHPFQVVNFIIATEGIYPPQS